MFVNISINLLKIKDYGKERKVARAKEGKGEWFNNSKGLFIQIGW